MTFEELQQAHAGLDVARLLKMLTSPDGAISILYSRDWWKVIPEKAGVYAIFDGNKLIYCGETGNLRSRMQEFHRTVNHTFRRNLGRSLFGHSEDFKMATAKTKFAVEHEEILDAEMRKLTVKAVPVALGRIEIEQHIIETHYPRHNTKKARK